MKKKLIALVLSIVLASGSAGAVPAFAVETTAEGTVAEETADAERTVAEETADAEGTVVEETAAAEESVGVSIEEAEEAGEAGTGQETEDAIEDEDVPVEEESVLEAEETDYEDESFDMQEEAAGSVVTGEIAAEEEKVLEEDIKNTDAVSADAKGTVVQSGSCGANVNWTWDNAGILTISGTGPMKDYSGNLSLPWTNYAVSTVIIEEGVTTIGNSAFSVMLSITSVTIPDSVTSIGEYAFHYCTGITSLTLPKALKSIGKCAFDVATNLEGISIPDTVTNIGESAFSHCENITDITIPEGVKVIRDSTFFDCPKLKNVELKAVTTIESSAFRNCDELEKVTLPDSLTSIRSWAFSGDKNLTDLSLPENLTSIGEDAFYDCRSLTRITLPSNLKTISGYAFEACNNLETVIMYNNISSIGRQAFDYCNLSTVYYIGTQDEWLATAINSNNKALLNANIIFMDDPYDLKYAEAADSSDAIYTGKTITPSPVVKQLGVTLKKGTDYKVTYSNNVKIGKAKVTITGIGKYTGSITKTFNIVLGKTSRGDMFNLANNVKVTWKAVTGAKYYKVYRSGVKEPVIVTTGLVGWDKSPGLKNGQKYTYKIVASLTGKGDAGGDSPLSYSKVMYRLKTVVIRSAKNTAPGQVTVKYDKTEYGDSYVLQYCEREDMVGAKTKVVLWASNTSYVIGGLKKGKTYYISIRVRKKVNGIDYYTTFGVPKKVTVTR